MKTEKECFERMVEIYRDYKTQKANIFATKPLDIDAMIRNDAELEKIEMLRWVIG